MKRRLLLAISGFVVILVLHALYIDRQHDTLAARWVQLNETSFSKVYLGTGEYFIGVSYALALGFTIYALVRFLENRRGGAAGLIGGVTTTGVLYVAGCFLLGCCGSPMLAVYLTLFGSSFIGFAKPLTFILTLTSVVIGFVWMERKSKSADSCCEGEDGCKQK